MSRKEIAVKHAVKKAVAALRIVFIPALLLSSRGTLMNVQAVCETQIPPEHMIAEAEPETAVQMQTESGEAEARAQTETAEEETQTQAEAGEAETQTQAETGETEAQAQAESAEEEARAQTEAAEEAMSVTMVGDSVMLGAAPSILGMLPDCVIDAKVSRQVIQADSVIDSLEKQDALGQTVVLALGTNGTFSTAKGQELIDRLGSGRTIYWVTVYGRELSWQEDSNATIRQLAEDNENVRIIDWSQAASGHAEWLCADGIHLNAEGQKAYAGIILGSLS